MDEWDNLHPEGACLDCGGPLVLLGILGTTEHYRCRNCGVDNCHAIYEEIDCDEIGT